jgi:hypothetical protein
MPRKARMIDPNDPMVILARVALEEQAEKATERQNKKRSQEQALKQHEATEKARDLSDAQRARFCDHLLGNHGIGVIPDRRFCGLNKHTLSSKEHYVRCQKCRFEWRPDDTDKVWPRWEGGEGSPERKRVGLPNPTNMGWAKINRFLHTFGNANDLTSRAFRIERVEPETFEDEEAPITA